MPDIFLSLPFYGAAVSAAIMTPAILLQESIELDDEEEDAETIANRFIALKETLPDDAPSSASIERLCVPTSIRLPSPLVASFSLGVETAMAAYSSTL